MATEVPDRTAPLGGRRSSGWWGALFGVLVLAAVLGYLLYSYFYLYVTVAEWPPGGIPVPSLLEPAVAAGVLLATLAPLPVVRRGYDGLDAVVLRRGAVAVAVAGVVGLVAVGVVVARLDGVDETTAYGSIVLVLHAFFGLVAAVGVVMAGAVAYHATVAVGPTWVRSAGAVLEVWWGFAVLSGVGVLAVTTMWPRLA